MEDKILVLCEKNQAARRVAQILSNGKMRTSYLTKVPIHEFKRDTQQWKVIGLRGHLLKLDYPPPYNQWNSTSLRELIWAEPIRQIEAKTIAGVVEKFLKESDELIIATDFDREGELIGVESFSRLKPLNIPIKRARFSSLTPKEINHAFENLVGVDYNLAKAAESREFVDLVWGAVLTRFFSLASNRLGKNFLSVGRVQSPTLALIINREKEIAKFKPTPYWEIIAQLENEEAISFYHSHQPFWEEQRAKEVYEKVKDAKEGIVKKLERKKVYERAPIPFNTTGFLQAASAIGIGLTSSMQIAEALYRRGYISYPRTDNQVYPRNLDLRFIVNKLLSSKLSNETKVVLTNPKSSPTQGKFAHDHPPIYPVDLPKEKLSDKEERIYELISRRFLATLSKDAFCESLDMEIEINKEKFKAQGYRIIEPHWRKIYPLEGKREKIIPLLEPGEIVKILKVHCKQAKTKPPKRFTQASLLGKMEWLGLGTKSTRHEIIKKLYDRKYIKNLSIKPSLAAEAIIKVLEDYASSITLPSMTAHLEQQMDLVAKGETKLDKVTKESRQMLSAQFADLEIHRKAIGEEIIKALKEQESLGKCPECGNPMLIRLSREGKRFIGCSNYPKCKNTYPLPKYGKVIPTPQFCERCGAPIIKVLKKRRAQEICVNPRCKKNRE
jgi:DNA topoisomerase-1